MRPRERGDEGTATPEEGRYPGRIFAQRNLWSVEIQSTCEQVIEYYEGILLLVDQGGCTDPLPS